MIAADAVSTGEATGKSKLLLGLLLVAAALLVRAPALGNPVYHIDEQFYRLVGDAMLRGELPYVDIWDRKPIGLFLLYAAIQALAGAGVYPYQIIAGLFALATAFVIARLAGRIASPLPAHLAGIAYLATLPALGGNGGQSPVFYNLLIATAALWTWQASERANGGGKLDGFGKRTTGAMLLAGFVLFIKQVSVFEGAFFGAVLLWALWKRTRSFVVIARWAVVFAACGLAPTALAFAGYALAGHADAFWFANFGSIFLKHPLGSRAVVMNAALIAVVLLPLTICASAGLIHTRRLAGPRHDATRFLYGWLAAAFVGLIAVPSLLDHYALPLTVPLCVAAAAFFDRPRAGRAWALVPIVWGLVMSSWPNAGEAERAARRLAVTQSVVRRHIGDGCLYVWEGPVAIYGGVRRCRLSPYVFPDHLNSALERDAIGVSTEAELRRILARRPTVVVTAPRLVHPTNLATLRILTGVLARDYQRVALIPDLRRDLSIWALKRSGARRPPPRTATRAASLAAPATATILPR